MPKKFQEGAFRRCCGRGAGGGSAITNLTLTFDPAKFGVRFAPSPEGLAEALRRACGEDRAAYGIEKQRQLEELGYEDGGLEAEALFGEGAQFRTVLTGGVQGPARGLTDHGAKIDVRLGQTPCDAGDALVEGGQGVESLFGSVRIQAERRVRARLGRSAGGQADQGQHNERGAEAMDH